MSEDRQRVNIQVSVRLDNLEQEVQQMLLRAKEIVEEAAVDTLPTVGDPFNEQTFNRIHNIRMDLADADAALQDASNIINSYVLYRAQQRQQTQPAEMPQPAAQDQDIDIPGANVLQNNDVLSELEKKISMFREKLDNTEHQALSNVTNS